jgi:PHD/YefM family antitoxin component YafN of YafNO toxin-antitoxin module
MRRKNMRKFQEQYIVDEKGQKMAVVLPVKEYEELLEDLHDLAIIAERRSEPTIAFEELKKRLKEDGLL